MESRITNRGGFPQLDVIWCEVIRRVEYLKGGQKMFLFFVSARSEKENDREISEWYNEVNGFIN